MNKRETVLDLVNAVTPPNYVPAAFFLHFDPVYHRGQPAIDKQMEFFAATGMDLLKIQYEQTPPPAPPIKTAQDWANLPRCGDEFFEPTFGVVKGLLAQAQAQAPVILTIYSPFMWAKQTVGEEMLNAQLKENPDAVARGLAIMTENVLTLVRGCKRLGIDGFYVSTQGGESYRFARTPIFQKYIKPTDLAVWDEARSCTFNILHVCDFDGGYDDLNPYLDYPGHVVNCSLKVGDKLLTPKEAGKFFGRPFMGGMDRHGVLATGTAQEIQQTVQSVLADAPDRFILGADCTVPANTPWENLKTAISAAHAHRK